MNGGWRAVNGRKERDSIRIELDEQRHINGLGGSRELKLITENAKLRKALEFYAAPGTLEHSNAYLFDCGDIAKEALK